MASSSTHNITSRQRKQSKRAYTELEAPSCSESESGTPSANYHRWYIIQGTDQGAPLSKLSAFIIDKALKAAAGNLKTVKRLQKGDILVEVSSAVQSRCISELSSFAGCPIQVTPHRTLNISKGVIRCSELQNCNKEEILEELKTQQVQDIQNISVKNDSGGRRNTNTYIITFSTPTIPKHLKIGFIRVPVAVFIPNPLRCFKCQKFGHGSKTCKGSITCSTCGQVGHSADSCQGQQPKCFNCSGSHPASSKDCPKWLFEKKVQQVKAEKGISFTEARGIVMSMDRAAPTSRGQPLAAVVRSGSGPRRPTTRSIHSQTDLTWPRDLENPTLVPSSAHTSLPLPSTSSQTQTDDTCAQAVVHAAGAREKTCNPSRVSPRPGRSSEGPAPFKPPRGTRTSPSTRTKSNKPRLNRPPKDNAVNIHNRYDALSDMEDDVYTTDLDNP